MSDVGASTQPALMTKSLPLTLHWVPEDLVLQVWTKLLQVPVRSGQAQGPAATVTLNAQVLVLPATSIAVQVTGVVPSRKSEPLAGTQLVEATPQLSVTVTLKSTTDSVTPAATLEM